MSTPASSSSARTNRLSDRKSTRLNSSHTVIYTLSLHDALPISLKVLDPAGGARSVGAATVHNVYSGILLERQNQPLVRSEEHTSELQSHRDLHSFPTRRSSDFPQGTRSGRWCTQRRSRNGA